MADALEALTNIDDVTVTWEEVITSDDDTAGTLEVRYNITFDGDCVRGNIPTGDLAHSCFPSATAVLADVECRCAVLSILWRVGHELMSSIKPCQNHLKFVLG